VCRREQDVLPDDAIHPARYWHWVEDGRLQCDLRPRFCRLRDSQRGLCFVRARAGEQRVLTTYGRSSGFCVDPIEKKPLNHFLPGTPVLCFGTAGCNLTCHFCQNWDISKSRQVDTLADAACHDSGIATVTVTAGEICEIPRREFFASMDATDIDLKTFDQTFYHELCSGDLATVLETLSFVAHETDTWLEITTLLAGVFPRCARHLGCQTAASSPGRLLIGRRPKVDQSLMAPGRRPSHTPALLQDHI
jgi:pyruvate formate lyase activating enzyme